MFNCSIFDGSQKVVLMKDQYTVGKGRRYAKKRKGNQTRNTTEQTRNRTSKQQQTRTKTSETFTTCSPALRRVNLEPAEMLHREKKITDYSLSLPGHTSGFPHLSLNSFLLHPVSNKSKCLLNRFICCESFEVLSFHMSLNDDGE